jgi:hypothetical protein
MSGYTKLFDSIFISTVWQEDHATRIVWIALLGKKDMDGIVEGSIPGLAHLARVTIPEAEAAISKFLAPDPHSRTPDYDGRRLEAVDGGWRVLNHEKYRDMLSEDDRRERDRKRQQRHRERKRHTQSTTERDTCDKSQMSHHPDTVADTVLEKEAGFDWASFVSDILKAHPKPRNNSKNAIIDATHDHARESGVSLAAARIYIYNRNALYAAHVAKWPEEKKHKAHNCFEFFSKGIFKNDPATWWKPDPPKSTMLPDLDVGKSIPRDPSEPKVSDCWNCQRQFTPDESLPSEERMFCGTECRQANKKVREEAAKWKVQR